MSAALCKLADELARQPRIAVDTESNSLHAYREQVCLIQFSTPHADYLVDPLALCDLSPLVPLFANPKIEKVFHAAEYDLLCLKRDFGIAVTNLFDTMQAARILGYKQVGLDALLTEKFDVRVNKRYQKANWGYRPLSPDLLNYARFDTHYLLDLRDILQTELKARDRWALAREEFVRLSQTNGVTENETPAWQRLGGTQKFTERQSAILQELCRWRESQAELMDRPVFKVLDEKWLVAMAQSTPKTRTELETLGLSDRQIRLYGDGLLHAITRGQRAAPLRRRSSPRPNNAYLNRLDTLREWRKSAALAISVESDVVLPKSFLHVIAEKNPSSMEALAKMMPNSPWRLEHYGPEILAILKQK